MLDDHPSAPVTSEQIVSTATTAAAMLIDAWGVAHPLARRTLIGRSAAVCGLAVLHPTVSAVHARMIQDGEVWELVDCDSRNGTFVDGRAIERAAIFHGARLRFGLVELELALAAPPARRRRRQTTPSSLSVVRTLTSPSGVVASIAGEPGHVTISVGAAIVALSPRESALLGALLARWTELGGASGAYVAWHELALACGFQSIEADSDNVRELVRRVRTKLAAAGLRDLIASRTGAGYCLATR